MQQQPLAAPPGGSWTTNFAFARQTRLTATSRAKPPPPWIGLVRFSTPTRSETPLTEDAGIFPPVNGVSLLVGVENLTRLMHGGGDFARDVAGNRVRQAKAKLVVQQACGIVLH